MPSVPWRRLALGPPGWLLPQRSRSSSGYAAAAVDDPDQLGLVADDDYAIALVLPGLSDDLAAAVDVVTVAYVVDRGGACTVAVAIGDAVDTVDTSTGVTGFIDDLARRMLRLPSAPESTSSALLILSVWLQNLLDASSDPETSGGIATWTDASGSTRVARRRWPLRRPRHRRYPPAR